jgi:hypothetical protein
MQVVMWLILCATLGLAEIVTRSRSAQGTQPVRVGPVVVRLPYGWKQDSIDAVGGLRAHDPEGQRRLFVVVTPLTTEIPEAGADYQGDARVDFKGLHRIGYMDLEQQTTGDQEVYMELVAKVMVPSARIKLRIGFVLPQPEATGVDISLLQRIAGGITLSGNSPRPQLHPPDGDVVLRTNDSPSVALSR